MRELGIPQKGKVLIADYSMDKDYDMVWGTIEDQTEQATKLNETVIKGMLAVEKVIETAFTFVFGRNFTDDMTQHCNCVEVEHDDYTEQTFSYGGKPFIRLGKVSEIGNIEKGGKLCQAYEVITCS